MEFNRGKTSNCLFRLKDRISKSSEIKEIIKNGIRVKCHFYNYYLKNNKVKRIGIIVRKFEKGTVNRNKVKRRLREIYRLNKEFFKNDTIIKVNKDLIHNTFFQLQNEILENIKNLNRGID